jgi:DNA-binding NtrC family response regulator
VCALRAVDPNSNYSQTDGKVNFSVLIVDDDYDFFEMLDQSIGDELSLDYAPDGFSAFKMVSKKTYDCIVSDINMPFMNGVTLLGEFQKKRLNIPVVLISGNINETVSKEALRAGAYNLLEKPFPIDELTLKIQNAIELHKKEQPSEADDQEKAYIYNTLKTYYYDIDQIMNKINKYQIPLSFIKDELEKKESTGKCHLDDPNNLKYYSNIPG